MFNLLYFSRYLKSTQIHPYTSYLKIPRCLKFATFPKHNSYLKFVSINSTQVQLQITISISALPILYNNDIPIANAIVTGIGFAASHIISEGVTSPNNAINQFNDGRNSCGCNGRSGAW